MKSQQNDDGAPDTRLWLDYRHNIARHILGVSRYFQSDIMRVLTEIKEYAGLRMGFEPFISLLGRDGLRLTELAAALGISKQACNQMANLIEDAGYIQRVPDLSDRRAKLVQLSATGLRLRADGIEAAIALEQRCCGLLGDKEFAELLALIAQLAQALRLPRMNENELSSIFLGNKNLAAALLPRLSDFVSNELRQRTIKKGHPGLKLSHGQVLTLISAQGARVHQLARTQSISKQAISAIALDLIDLGYVAKTVDANDQRSSILHLTAKGELLLSDSVRSVEELASYFAKLLGKEKYQRFAVLFKRLYGALHLEEDIFGPEINYATREVGLMAAELLQRLGPNDAKALADNLLQLIKEEGGNDL